MFLAGAYQNSYVASIGKYGRTPYEVTLCHELRCITVSHPHQVLSSFLFTKYVNKEPSAMPEIFAT
jgi:hypothetical protein